MSNPELPQRTMYFVYVYQFVLDILDRLVLVQKIPPVLTGGTSISIIDCLFDFVNRYFISCFLASVYIIRA